MSDDLRFRDEQHVRDAVERLTEYIRTYDQQHGYESYSAQTFIDDVLYGLGVAIEPKAHQFAQGFQAFKERLADHLGLVRADLAEEREREADMIRRSVREATSEEALGEDCGFWNSCAGCHETIDGAETGHYPYSDIFQCHLGAGCNECGGLGAVWNYWTESQLDEMRQDALATHEHNEGES